MKKPKAGSIRLLAHEKLVMVEMNEDTKVLGYAFGSDQSGNVIVCLRKFELLQAGISCDGPCINRFYSKLKVKFIDATKKENFHFLAEKEEEDELATDSDTDSDTGSDRVILDLDVVEEKGKRRKVKRKLKVKVK